MKRLFQLVIVIQLIDVIYFQLLLFYLYQSHARTCLRSSYGLPSTCTICERRRPYMSWRKGRNGRVLIVSNNNGRDCCCRNESLSMCGTMFFIGAINTACPEKRVQNFEGRYFSQNEYILLFCF